jgi:hypothetical protein
MRSGEGYPQHQTFQADGLGGQHGTMASYPGAPGSQPPVTGGPGRPPRKPLPTWWIAPFAGGAIVVLAVFAVLKLTVLHHSTGHPAAAGSSPAAAAPSGPLPAQMFPDALLKRLTKDVQGDDEKDFLSLVAPGAKPAVRTWWDNMQAIGYSTGLIMPTDKTDQVNVNATGDGTAVVLAGTHNAFDPVHNGKPDIPLEQYQIGLHFSSAQAIGQITAWKPLGNDPWDQGGQLYVRKSSDVEVVGPASASAVVDETVPIAEIAAEYDIGLLNHVHSSDLRQSGFVVFVSGDAASRHQWFSTTRQPSGWPGPASGSSRGRARAPTRTGA